MNTHIVTEPSALMRRIARDALKGRWKEMFLGIAIYTILTGYVKSILDMLFPFYRTVDYFGQQLMVNTSFVGSLYQVVLTGAFAYGLALFMLTFFRTRRIDNKLLFEGFSMIVKTILLQIVMTVFIFLWSLLFVIPGIIAALRYSMAFYILADHPEYSITQCINESKARMRGNCGKYFLMMLSFIGWAIVSSLASELIAAPLTTATGVSIGSIVGYFIALVPSIFLAVYVKTTETVFYELLTQNLVVMVPDQHVQDQGVKPDNMVNANYEVHEETAPKADPFTAAAGAAGVADSVMDKAADVFSDVTDKVADIQDKVDDKVADIIPDEISDKVDELAQKDETLAKGAPDVETQVYTAEETEKEEPKAEGPTEEFVVDPQDVITPEDVEDAVEEIIDEIDAFGGPKDEKDEL